MTPCTHTLQVEDSGLAGLALMTGLTALNLQECWQITAEGLAALSGGASCPLHVRRAAGITHDGCVSSRFPCSS